MTSSPLRVYGGTSGEDRRATRRAQLLNAALDLLSADPPAPVTVRGVCREAGLAARYFYEHFADREALVVAVFDHVVEEVATATLRAVTVAPENIPNRIRAGLEALIVSVADDPRRARILFVESLADPALARRRLTATRMFAHLLSGQARRSYGIGETPQLDLIAQFAVAGIAQVLTSWSAGQLTLNRAELLDHCTEIFLALPRPA
jgi:AcrR family transcriptional regulator